MKFITGSLISMALVLSGCVSSGPTKPGDPYKVDNASAFEKKQKVAIGSFKISFVTFDKSSSKVTGGSRREATFSPTGLPLYHASFMGSAPKPVPHLIYSVADESGVPILNVHILVHFAYFQGQTQNGNDKKATVNLGQVVRTEDGSQITLAVGHSGTFSNPNGTIQLTWGESTSMPYGITKDATSGAQKAANTFSSVVGMFSGGSSSAKELIITADPEKYRTAALDVIERTNGGFINKMAKLRN